MKTSGVVPRLVHYRSWRRDRQADRIFGAVL